MSCLFDSLSYFINRTSTEIRQIICNYLEENNSIIDGLETSFILELENKNYIKDMRRNNTWGGAIEIQSACNIWNIRILVHNVRKDSVIEFLPLKNKYNHTIALLWYGNHYEPYKK